MQGNLDNIGQPDQLLANIKRHVKAVSKAKVEKGRGLKRALDLLQSLVPLADQARLHVSSSHEFRDELYLAIEESKALLRDQGRTI
jgi:hypothetical protein